MHRLLEEVLPFIYYYKNRRNILAAASDRELINNDGSLSNYSDLSSCTINNRIKEEHDREQIIDEKTVKFTFTSTIALTLLSSISTFISKTITQGGFQSWSITLSAISVLYMLFGGLISLGALTTLPRYGYGTCYQIKAKIDQKIKIYALAAQEKVNSVRHIRNEAAYQCIRNGLLLLIVSVIVTLFGFFTTIINTS